MELNPTIQIDLTKEDISIPIASDLSDVYCGAVSVFIGKTRHEEHVEFGKLAALSYSCYEQMAITSLETIASEAVESFNILSIRITHSIAQVSINSPSVVIAVGSAHRKDALDACKFLIDQLKERTPIWKEEIWEHGATWSKGMDLQLRG